MIARRAIFRRYAVVLATALAGGLLAYAALELAFATRAQVERTRELHVSEARAVAGRISFFFEEIERSLVAIASLPWGAGLPDADRMTEYQGAMRRLPAVREVVLADAGGAELLFASRSDASRVGSGAAADRDLAARARPEAAAFGPVRLGSAGQAPSVQMAVRDRGAPARVTLATVDLQFVSDELARMPRRGGESAYMLDSAGRLVSHADVSRPLQRSDGPHPLHGATLAMPHGSAWARDAEGRRVLAVWHRSESLPWTVVVESPWQEALGPVMAALYRALVFIAIAIALAVFTSRRLADRMSRPVVTLKAGAETFGRGELDHRIEVRPATSSRSSRRISTGWPRSCRNTPPASSISSGSAPRACRRRCGPARSSSRPRAMTFASRSTRSRSSPTRLRCIRCRPMPPTRSPSSAPRSPCCAASSTTCSTCRASSPGRSG